MSRLARSLCFTSTVWLVFPAALFAQAAMTGSVKDPSGAVLPGVTVEAASPVLIEKARTAVTDGSGQFRIIDLRPGIYSLTFTLPGFSPLKREGIELTGSFTATVNAELRVGTVAETITVTGEAPVVDVQGTLRQAVINREVLEAIPAGRNARLLSTLIPGMSGGGADVGGQNALALGTVAIHGGNASDQRTTVDGVTLRNVAAEGSLTNFVPDMGSSQEVTIDFAASSAETMTGGVNFNYIPREGGNRFSGSSFATYVTPSFQGDNYTQELKDAGLGAPNRLKSLVDVNLSGGGPIKRDRMWFYSSVRYQLNERYVAGLWDNLNAGNPSKWNYEPDLSHQAVFNTNQASVNTRLTWQANARNKFNFYWDQQGRDNANTALPNSKEAGFYFVFPRLYAGMASWSAPLTSRLLVDGRLAIHAEDIRNKYPEPGSPFRTLIRVTEQGGTIPGLIYRGAGSPNDTSTGTFTEVVSTLFESKLSLSYVTGAHALKVGFGNNWGDQTGNSYDIPAAISYRFNNGVPNQIIERQTTYQGLTWGVRAELGVYAQDRWTLKRLTLSPGIRFDYFQSGFRDFHLGPATLAPTRNISFPESTWYTFKDISPRLGAVYDLKGDGKTALKVNLSRFMGAVSPVDGNPIQGRLVNRVNRSWTDANSNYVADCDLVNPNQQDLRAAGGDFCGTISDVRFGQAIASTNYDPETLEGWGKRDYNWEFSAGVQRQVAPRVSVDFGYFHRRYGNFTVTDNRSVETTDYTFYSVTAPTDPRLPDGGAYLVSGLANLNPNKVGLVDNYVTFSDNFGDQYRHWNGVDLTMNARPKGGVILQGGMSTGRTTSDNCDLTAHLDNPSQLYCHSQGAFLTQYKFLGTYTIPKVDVRISGTLQNLPGPQITASVVYPNAAVQPSLGRPLSGGAANVTVNVVEPGTMYGNRLNEIDMRFSKIFRYGRSRSSFNVDLYNLLNASTVRTLSSTYASWQRPTGILDARLVKLSVQIDF